MGKDECVVSKTNVKNVQQKMNEEGRRVVQKTYNKSTTVST